MMCQWCRCLLSSSRWRCFYRLVMWLMSKAKAEDMLEGKPVVIVENGQLAWENVKAPI